MKIRPVGTELLHSDRQTDRHYEANIYIYIYIYIYLIHSHTKNKNCILLLLFEPKMDEVTGEWKRIQNEELYTMYFSRNIIRVINYRRLMWAGHVACMGERCIQGFGGEI
jgi:hypothetical protein